MDLTPSLAFTALLELSEDWRDESLPEQQAAVAALTEDFKNHQRVFAGTRVGQQTMWEYARTWIKVYYRPDE